MSILVRSGTVRVRANVPCAVCGKPGVQVGATDNDGGEPEFYHWACMVKQASVAELVWSSEGNEAPA